jgi:C1A family cysteine protease
MAPHWCVILAATTVAANPLPAFLYTSKEQVHSPLNYFRHTAHMEKKVGSSGDFAGYGLHQNIGKFDTLSAKVNEHARRLCGGPERTWSLHSAAYDADGVQHAVLQHKDGGQWQYVAIVGDRLLVADPPLCAARGEPRAAAWKLARHGGGRRLPALESPEIAEEEVTMNSAFGIPDEAYQMLNSRDDEALMDCAHMFSRTAQDDCQKKYELQIHSATIEVVDGFEVKMFATVKDIQTGDQASHSILCFFDVPRDDEEEQHVAAEHYFDDVAGLEHTVAMSVDLCLAANAAYSESEERRLFEEHSFGEDSLYRGHRHVYDHLPRFFNSAETLGAARKLADSPPRSSVDLRTQFPVCFPTAQSTVLDQGQCGSCWAFASASAMMINLCIVSGGDASTKVDYGRRHDVSVQHILSCNSMLFGCDGGNANGADDAFTTHGIARWSDVPYQCGAGDPLNHFEKKSGSCEAFPWGGNQAQCGQVFPKWHLENLYTVTGPSEMMQALSTGYSLFSSLLVPKSLMIFRGSGVYKPEPKYQLMGGHAVVTVGYGNELGDPYWLVQNSWGTKWADGGFFKIGRGQNFLNFEETALIFRGYTEGAEAKMPAAVGDNMGNPFAVENLMNLFNFRGGVTHAQIVVLSVIGLVVMLKIACLTFACCLQRSKVAPEQYNAVQQYPFAQQDF